MSRTDLPEPERNRLLRTVDWRLALHGRGVPRLLDLRGGEAAAALALATEPAGDGPADLALLGFPRPLALKKARAALAPDGEVACLWSVPRPAGLQLAAARLRRAGFDRLRIFWPGPDPRHQPEFWLPLESGAAVHDLLSARVAGSRAQDAVRAVWQAARRGGALAPVALLAQAAGSAEPDELDKVLPPDGLSWLLHTGGEEIGSKIAGVPYPAGASTPPPLIAKFGRGEKADRGLRREAELLRQLEAERPEAGGAPRIHAEATRAGGVVTVQDAFHGPTVNVGLDRDRLAALAPTMTDWTIALAGDVAPVAPEEWRERLVEAPLDELASDFADLVDPALVARARAVLAGLGPLPVTWEHRDLGPWNLIDMGAQPAVIDWEDAEPRGLPLLDLTYFLTMSAATVAKLPGRAGEEATAFYGELLDPASTLGAIVAPCLERYREAVGLDPAEAPRLRLLAWVVQTLTVCRHMRGRGEDEALDPAENVFTSFAAAELERIEVSA
jgi:Phosphotransferase enzyme family